MKTSSAKAKGRRCAQETKDLLLKFAPHLSADDILVTSSGVTGEDLIFSPKAREVYNFVIENKNVEALNIWKAYEQATSHKNARPDATPVLFFKRNRTPLLVCLNAEDFLKLLKR